MSWLLGLPLTADSLFFYEVTFTRENVLNIQLSSSVSPATPPAASVSSSIFLSFFTTLLSVCSSSSPLGGKVRLPFDYSYMNVLLPCFAILLPASTWADSTHSSTSFIFPIINSCLSFYCTRRLTPGTRPLCASKKLSFAMIGWDCFAPAGPFRAGCIELAPPPGSTPPQPDENALRSPALWGSGAIPGVTVRFPKF